IRQYQFYLADHDAGTVKGWIQLDGDAAGQAVSYSIPELGLNETITADDQGRAALEFTADLDLWHPSNPKLYTVNISSGDDEITDTIGFRTIARDGKKILLNGEEIFLRGISMHDESYLKSGVAFDEADAREQLGLIKELNGNFVRLSHYPHNEYAVRVADEIGLLVWSEIPIVSLIDWDNPETLAVAQTQLRDNIHRDLNRASIIMWSIGNETMPQSQDRLDFLAELGRVAREEDVSGRLIAAALVGDVTKEFEEVGKRLAAQMINDPEVDAAAKAQMQALLDHAGVDAASVLEAEIEIMLNDRLGEVVDVIGYNEYFAWYYSSFLGPQFPVDEATVRRHMFDLMDDVRFRNVFGKPIIISEFGAGAKQGFRSEEALLWSEEYQAKVYEAQTSMLANSDYVQGMSPWILKDFRSALRNLNGIQDIYNRKGIVSETGQKKLAFYVLQNHYAARVQAERDGDE
ncbi:MAG: glycoside hydrolase family 2 TIM barrel-domain containing protein, partial [Pseudomonadota bacterium]